MNPQLQSQAEQIRRCRLEAQSDNAITWRLALVDLAILEGQLLKYGPDISAIIILEPTRKQ